MWSAFLLIGASSHVPTYTGACTENCCTPPRVHTVSQVIYLKGSGGLEIHIQNDTYPINARGGEVLDVDAVFRDEIDPSTYSLYIGCGGCVASVDPIVVDAVHIDGYQPAEVEPFTQTVYRSALPTASRKYDSALLQHERCLEKHFTIRLVDYMNRTDGKPIVWAPVIGLAEQFTFTELLEFPIYVLRNHGDAWNELGYTFWLWLFLGAPLLLYVLRWMRSRLRKPVLTPFRRTVRELLYEIALVGFLAAALEETTHLVYVQMGAPIEYGFIIGILAVILFAQGVPILFVCYVWTTMYHPSWKTSHPWWAPLEVVTGFSVLLLFGSGFYVGPVGIMLAGLVRANEISCYSQTRDVEEDVELHDTITSPSKSHKSPSLGFIR